MDYNTKRKRRKRRRINRKRQLRIRITLFFVTVTVLSVLLFRYVNRKKPDGGMPQEGVEEPVSGTEGATEGTSDEGASDGDTGDGSGQEETQTEGTSSERPVLEETDVYTFLQGPVAWNSKADWSGAWCDVVLAGQRFSVFGCGLCDLANIYSTLTEYDCSPLDMYDYAREVSDYAPVSGFGAIDWPEMQQTLETVGIYSELYAKDDSYEAFQDKVREALSVIALVSSADDRTYWQDVEGHYVNLWLYDEESDTVLVGDSGNPGHNRQRIPLRYVYDALKTAADIQYMLVTDVDADANSWKHDGIEGDWNPPDYYQ